MLNFNLSPGKTYSYVKYISDIQKFSDMVVHKEKSKTLTP